MVTPYLSRLRPRGDEPGAIRARPRSIFEPAAPTPVDGALATDLPPAILAPAAGGVDVEVTEAYGPHAAPAGLEGPPPPPPQAPVTPASPAQEQPRPRPPAAPPTSPRRRHHRFRGARTVRAPPRVRTAPAAGASRPRRPSVPRRGTPHTVARRAPPPTSPRLGPQDHRHPGPGGRRRSRRPRPAPRCRRRPTRRHAPPATAPARRRTIRRGVRRPRPLQRRARPCARPPTASPRARAPRTPGRRCARGRPPPSTRSGRRPCRRRLVRPAPRPDAWERRAAPTERPRSR